MNENTRAVKAGSSAVTGSGMDAETLVQIERLKYQVAISEESMVMVNRKLAGHLIMAHDVLRDAVQDGRLQYLNSDSTTSS